MNELDRHAQLDARLVAAVRPIRLLSAASWPAAIQQQFLDGWRHGEPVLPAVTYPHFDLSQTRHELDAIARAADSDHPIGEYLQRNVDAWQIAASIMESLGHAQVGALSAQLFGLPGEMLPGDRRTNLDAANHFVLLADELDAEIDDPDGQATLPAETVRDQLQAALDPVFQPHRIDVQLDPDLVAKAAAGASRVRLRANSLFSPADVRQLLEHEVLVHSLTAINGREQPHLKSLGRTSPRVTATQEGLATFAEQITGSIDIRRMKRISLRILAIDQALRGADFVEVFRFFRHAGNSRVESFSSAMRVFRGVPTHGGAAFCKDTVYLHGLLSVHTFFRWALKHRRLDLMRWLFAGKLALHDVFRLQPLFQSGWIAPPLYLPPWIERSGNLAGLLAFSLFIGRIRMDSLEAEDITLAI